MRHNDLFPKGKNEQDEATTIVCYIYKINELLQRKQKFYYCMQQKHFELREMVLPRVRKLNKSRGSGCRDKKFKHEMYFILLLQDHHNFQIKKSP